MKKWLTPLLIFSGAVLLIGSGGFHTLTSDTVTIWFKIVGLICIMWGIYRAFCFTRKKAEQNDWEHD